MYRVMFSRRAEKAFLNLPDKETRRIKEAIEKLKQDPRTHGTIKLENAPVAAYRYRVGDGRILFDIDDVRFLALVKAIMNSRFKEVRIFPEGRHRCQWRLACLLP